MTRLGTAARAEASTLGLPEDDHEQGDRLAKIADWYSRHRDVCGRPVVPALRERFGLSLREALRVFELSNTAALKAIRSGVATVEDATATGPKTDRNSNKICSHEFAGSEERKAELKQDLSRDSDGSPTSEAS